MNHKLHNRRKFHRIKFNGQVSVEIGDESYDCCHVRNLSLTGMYVAGDFKHDKAGGCLINFVRDENPEKIYLRAAGEVVWGNEEGIGLKFTAMKMDHYQLFVTTLINNAELPVVVLGQLPPECPFDILSM